VPVDRCTADGVDTEKEDERELAAVGGVVRMGGGFGAAMPHKLQ